MMKKVLKNILLVIAVLLLLSPLWIKLVPMDFLSPLVGTSAITDQYLCKYSTKVSGQSMDPLIPPGTTIDLTRCFKTEDLTKGTVVMFKDNSVLRVGIIRYVLQQDPVVYKISNEKEPELFQNIIMEEIVAITHDIDVSHSVYQADIDEQSFILNPEEYVSDFYLAKIPKGAGIETSTIERTLTFSQQEDKFCYVVVPKNKLTAIDIVITNTATQEETPFGNNIVFDTSTEPNVNCIDFGSGKELLNLQPGMYQYRFLMNHQVLKDIQFEVT